MRALQAELRHLRYFVAVAEELHFGRAAARLGIAQPPLSQQIQRLEQIVGFPLFVRSPRVELTAAGKALLEMAQRTLREAENSLEIARRAGQGRGGTLSIGFASSTILTDLPALVRVFRSEYPDVGLSLHEISTASQIDALRSRVIDLGVMREPLAEGGILSEVLLREPFVTVLPSRHPLVSRRALSLRSLSGEPFIHFPREVAPGLYDRMRGIFFQSGFTPPVIQEAREWVTVVALVEAGLGVSVVPASFKKLRWGSVVYRPLTGVDALTNVSLCRRQDETSRTVQRFIELAHAQCGDAVR